MYCEINIKGCNFISNHEYFLNLSLQFILTIGKIGNRIVDGQHLSKQYIDSTKICKVDHINNLISSSQTRQHLHADARGHQKVQYSKKIIKTYIRLKLNLRTKGDFLVFTQHNFERKQNVK